MVDTKECSVKDAKGKDVGSVKLDPAVFGARVLKNGEVANVSLVHETVRWQRARKRAGTHATLSRSEIKGGKKKPFKQKGTGRARAGSSVSPLWVGGAIVFGPEPRDYDYRLSKRTRRTALRAALSQKASEQKIVLAKSLEVDGNKTKNMVALLETLGVADKKVLVLIPGADASKSGTWRALRNICSVKPLSIEGLNAYDVLNAEVLVSTEAGLEAISKRLGAKA